MIKTCSNTIQYNIRYNTSTGKNTFIKIVVIAVIYSYYYSKFCSILFHIFNFLNRIQTPCSDAAVSFESSANLITEFVCVDLIAHTAAAAIHQAYAILQPRERCWWNHCHATQSRVFTSKSARFYHQQNSTRIHSTDRTRTTKPVEMRALVKQHNKRSKLNPFPVVLLPVTPAFPV